jgi:ribA/ribD-fused uncharacterized protein
MAVIRFYRAIGPWGFLSNLFPCEIVFEGRAFRSPEDAYQYSKPRDAAVAQWLVSSPSPRLTALAAHALFWYDVSPEWNAVKVARMRAVLCAKFAQYPALAERLIATGDAVLVENSKTDAFWGVGKNGNGKNRLGELLMEIREELKGSRTLSSPGQKPHSASLESLLPSRIGSA